MEMDCATIRTMLSSRTFHRPNKSRKDWCSSAGWNPRLSGQQCRAVCTGSETLRDLRKFVNVQGPALVGAGKYGRGLFLGESVLRKGFAARVPMDSVLLITDEPIEGISIIGDQHVKRFQQIHGDLPDALVSFITSSARWDARLCSWLLYLISLRTGFKSSPSPPSCIHVHDRPDEFDMWTLFLDSLPTISEMTLLLAFAPIEQLELQHHRYIVEAELQRDVALRYHYDYFWGPASELGNLGLSPSSDLTLWVLSLVRSRSFGLTIDGEAVTLMAPYLDLANHSPSYTASFRVSPDRQHFELYTFSDACVGSEVLISYGTDKGNFELMRDYGFVVPNNEADMVFLIDDLKRLLSKSESLRSAEAAGPICDALRLARQWKVDAPPKSGNESDKWWEMSSVWDNGAALQDDRNDASESEANLSNSLSCYLLCQAMKGQRSSGGDLPFVVQGPEQALVCAAVRSLRPLLLGTAEDPGALQQNRPRGIFAQLSQVRPGCAGEPPVELATEGLHLQEALCRSLLWLLGHRIREFKTSVAVDKMLLVEEAGRSVRYLQAIHARLEYKVVTQAIESVLQRCLHYILVHQEQETSEP